MATGLGNWGVDPSNEAQSIRQTNMTVGFDGNWKVESGGAPVMDTNVGTTLWPGCLIAANAGGSPCDWGDPVTAGLNDLFRWCPPAGSTGNPANGTTLRAPLGQCDGATYTTATP